MRLSLIVLLLLVLFAAPAWLLWNRQLACGRTQAEANRALVMNFNEQVFNQHQVEKGAQALAEDYREHNPQVPSGRAAFIAFMTDYLKKNPAAGDTRVVRSAVDGDLVWLHGSGRPGPGLLQAGVDIFRVKNGQIVEHWDVTQPVPEKAENSNTMF